MFEPGDEVICIRDLLQAPFIRRAARRYGITIPKLGERYTIRSVFPHPGYSDFLITYLQEIANPVVPYLRGGHYEAGFPSKCFRKVNKNKADEKWVTGAPIDSERWDNRRVPAKRREKV